jgi:cation-transporting ATPase E
VINNIERVASLFLAKTTYSVVLSTLTGVFALAYPLRPIHLSILSWFTIGVPAFFLALEPNDDRVQHRLPAACARPLVPAGLVIAGSPSGCSRSCSSTTRSTATGPAASPCWWPARRADEPLPGGATVEPGCAPRWSSR